MQTPQNVQIPLSLFSKIIMFFELLSISGQEFPKIYGFDNILCELRSKQQKINLRAAYTETIYARSDEQKHTARMNYQNLKRS